MIKMSGGGDRQKSFPLIFKVEDIFGHNSLPSHFHPRSSLGSAHWPDYTGANIPGDRHHIRYNCISNNRQGSCTKVS